MNKDFIVIMKQKIKTISVICYLMIASSSGFGQQAVDCDQEIFIDSLLDNLTWQWVANGTVGEDKVVYDISAEWVLNHQFLEMTLVDTAAMPSYSAKVFIGYDCQNSNYVIHWIDNFGGPFSATLGSGTRKEYSLEMLFEYPDERLKNTFYYDIKTDQWISHSVYLDEQQNWQTFAHLEMHRIIFK